MLKSFDPMFSDSSVAVCTLSVSTDGGQSSTVPVRVLNPTSDLLASLGACLQLAIPEKYVQVTPAVGPYVLVNVANVTDWFAAVYDAKLFQCISRSQQQRVVRSFSLVSSYAALDAAVPVGSPARIEIRGVNASLSIGAYRLVRSEFDCGDIGTPLDSCTSGLMLTCTATPSFVGSYTLCADCGDGFYKVPSNQFVSIVNNVDALQGPAVQPCGGQVDKPVVVLIATAPGTLYSQNGSEWSPAPSSLLVVAPVLLTVRSAGGVQTACSFYVRTAPPVLSLYVLSFVGVGVRVSIVGSGVQTDAAVVTEVHRSASCSDVSPLFSFYLTSNLDGWSSDGALSLALSSLDTTALYLCVAGIALKPSGVTLSPLALSTVACSSSPYGCVSGLPTCVSSGGILQLCSRAPPSQGEGISLKLLLLILYGVTVMAIVLVWRAGDKEKAVEDTH
jgi:hypothetical protein